MAFLTLAVSAGSSNNFQLAGWKFLLALKILSPKGWWAGMGMPADQKGRDWNMLSIGYTVERRQLPPCELQVQLNGIF
jgi:hypothetical protein